MTPSRLVAPLAVAIGVLAVACSGASGDALRAPAEVAAQPPAPPAPAALAAQPPAAPASPAPTAPAPPTVPEQIEAPVSPEPSTQTPKAEVAEPTAAPTDTPALTDEPSRFLTRGWATDFSKHSVPFNEIMSGGPPRDGIPPIDNPKYIDVADPPEYMRDNAPVISVDINGDARAYPLAILISHEIVNDEVGGVPVTVTYCPLCNTAIVFDRRVDGRVLDFGTSGNLRNSDLVMWDRQTESWWQQITGEAIVGELTGTVLTFIPAPVLSWSTFRDGYPDGKVLSRDTGFFRNYDSPPYGGYDDLGNTPFLFRGDIDSRLDAMERVVTISVDDVAVAYPFGSLAERPVINDTVNGQDVVIFYAGGTLSAFAGRGSSENRTVGSSAVYDPQVDGQKLTFKVESDIIVDEETGSKWDILGRAVQGPLSGSQLDPFVHANHFWFAWAAFNPETEVRTGDGTIG